MKIYRSVAVELTQLNCKGLHTSPHEDISESGGRTKAVLRFGRFIYIEVNF